MNDRKHVRRDETIPISISAGERDLIKKHTFIDLELEEIPGFVHSRLALAQPTFFIVHLKTSRISDRKWNTSP